MRTSALDRSVLISLIFGATLGFGACSSGMAVDHDAAGGDAGAGGGAGGQAGGSAGSSLDAAAGDTVAVDDASSDQAADGCCDGSGLSDASDASDAEDTGVAMMVTIPGTSNLWGAGHALPPDPSGHGPGTLPTVVDLPPGTGRTMTLTRVSGATDYDGPEPGLPEVGADGVAIMGPPPAVPGPASVSLDGIAGPLLPPCSATSCSGRFLFLAAVFLDATEPADPAPAPHPIEYMDAVVDGLGLRQTFFVGDGFNGQYMGTGVVQTFHIPDEATRVYFGFFDFYGPGGPIGSYSDNTGQLKATVTISR